jgi:hypothetical protein
MGVKRESLRSAWLVTWEWSGDHARVEDPVVALFNRPWDGKAVRLIVEQLYSALKYSISDKFAVARNRKNTILSRREISTAFLGSEKYHAATIHGCALESLRMFDSRSTPMVDEFSIGTNVHWLSESTKNPVHT